MAESATKRVGKFTVLTEEATSATGTILGPEAADENQGSKGLEDSLEPFTLKTRQASRKRTPRAPKVETTVVGEIAQAPADYKLWSQIFIGSANTVVVTWLGGECAMEKREAEMLEPPLARMLSRMPVGTSQKMSTFIDPMVMLIALGMWGNRIVRIQRAKRDNGISDAERARATGVVASVPETNGVQNTQDQQPAVEPDYYPTRSRVDINPNGVPVAITNQIGEV